ncbi:MAG: Uma2 family endonuclease [Chloroflexota bacterium]|nr:Uma2 family endonuclease [Chloroflexota bacterium]
MDGAPDLAVEVLSEGQHGEAYAKPKVREYFEAGAQLVWLVDVNRREVRLPPQLRRDHHPSPGCGADAGANHRRVRAESGRYLSVAGSRLAGLESSRYLGRFGCFN